MNLYFLGGGNMASSIIAGLNKKESLFKIFVVDKNEDKLKFLQDNYSVNLLKELPYIDSNDILFIAIKPQDLKVACKDINIDNNALIISIVAGISINSISSWMRSNTRIIRAMPNLPSQVLRGITGIYANKRKDKDIAIANIIFSSIGKIFWFEDEKFLDSITSISGIWPGCLFYLMDKVYKEACNLGFSNDISRELVLETFGGSVDLAKESGLDFVQLQNKVASKGGVTQCALDVFDELRIKDIIHKSIKLSLDRSKDISKNLG